MDHSNMDHSNMDHSSMDSSMSSNSTMSSMSGVMGMDHMMMTFFTSTSTALYADSWMPANSGQYAGTCIFLIALAAIFRGIVALRTNFPALLAIWAHQRDTSILRADSEDDGKWMLAVARRPWNINEALARAVLDTVLAGVSYLLMLAVMTMNVGYFMSILAGTFFGSFVIGDWQPTAAHCDGH